MTAMVHDTAAASCYLVLRRLGLELTLERRQPKFATDSKVSSV